MVLQIGFRPPSGTTVPAVVANGSNVQPAITNKNSCRTTRKLLAAGSLALGIGSCLFAGAGTAAADGLDATPMPPAVIDEDGFQTYDTSSYPADPTWPAPPSWGSYPADSTWPGKSSHPCCSR